AGSARDPRDRDRSGAGRRRAADSCVGLLQRLRRLPSVDRRRRGASPVDRASVAREGTTDPGRIPGHRDQTASTDHPRALMSLSAAAHPLLLDPHYVVLKQHLIESTGLAYYADKDEDLAARIGARLSQLSLNGCGAYLDLLKDQEAGESERHLLIGQLTI